MSAALKQLQFISGNAIDDPVDIVNSSGSPSRKLTLQRLGFTNALKRIALNIPNEHVDAFERRPALLLPIQVVLPSLVMP
jgi:hypothetical protein